MVYTNYSSEHESDETQIVLNLGIVECVLKVLR